MKMRLMRLFTKVKIQFSGYSFSSVRICRQTRQAIWQHHLRLWNLWQIFSLFNRLNNTQVNWKHTVLLERKILSSTVIYSEYLRTFYCSAGAEDFFQLWSAVNHQETSSVRLQPSTFVYAVLSYHADTHSWGGGRWRRWGQRHQSSALACVFLRN